MTFSPRTARREFTAELMEPMMEEKTPMANRITKMAKSLADKLI